MPVVDFEVAWFALKAHIASKGSHGARELAEKMAEIEVGHRIPEAEQGFDDRPVPARVKRSSPPDGRPAHAAEAA